MSHMTTINTNLRSEPFIRKALEKLGFQVEEDQKVPYYYGQPKQSSLVFGAGTATDHESGIAYRCGLNYEDTGREADNGYTFMTDYWGMDCSKEGQEVLDRLGCERVNPSDPNSAHWKWERGGHVGVSGPKKLQQVYVGEVVQYASQYQGRRLTTIEMPNGDVRHEQRGGDLGNQVVVVTALKDGSVKIHVEGGDGESCLVATKFLEDILGTFASREMLPESQRAGVQAAARASA